MMRSKLLSTVLSIGALTLVGCGGGGDSGTAVTDPVIVPTEIDVNVTITGDYQVESLGTATTINTNVSVGNTPKSLYLVLSNSATTSATSTITHNAKVTTAAQSKTVSPAEVKDTPHILRHPQYVEDFNAQIGTLLSKTEVDQFQAKTIAVPEKMEDIVGNRTTFYLSSDTSLPTSATARKVVSDGVITLNIWVSDDSYDESGSGIQCQKVKCVTSVMVDELANMFLMKDPNNDIYDWVTNVYGEEWGSDAENKYSNLISDNNQITILLTDIPNREAPVYNTPNGGVIGFFWAKDNFIASSTDGTTGSNERVMFYIDSVMFANGETTWSIDDYWPKEVVSTLAHEFQHMIHFYQKTILRINENTETWLNEMLSESTEDLVATKIRHIGPRGVDYLDGSAGDPGNTLGRYPLFNENNTLSLTAWNGVLADYSKVNAFGAYLLRNYGGAQVLHDIMHNAYIDENAVVYAVKKSPEGTGKTFSDLLSEWGIAVMLSDHIDLIDTPEYNTGDFTLSTYNNSTYELGSINFFNYDPLPTIQTTSGTVQPQGNYYYKIGDNVTGDFNITLELNGQTEATLIAK
ncbi:MAG TPA: hypothetical protein VIM88_06010 [Sulfurovum sp.]|uniref:M30 family zinc metallopeptidase n=1 Tax=Sulfurovum sp. TaxID=1969726 RepID=UPI002F925396